MASEMDDEAERGSRTIGGLDGIAQADIVQLRAQSEVRKKTDIHAAAETIGKLVRRAAAGSSRQTRPAKQDLRKFDFTNANLEDATLDGCNLTDGRMAGANLKSADLQHATLKGARLKITLDRLPYQVARWISGPGFDPRSLELEVDALCVEDRDQNPLALFKSEWNMNYAQGKHADWTFAPTAPSRPPASK